MYFVVAYVMSLNHMALYVGAAVLSVVYLSFVAYLVSPGHAQVPGRWDEPEEFWVFSCSSIKTDSS